MQFIRTLANAFLQPLRACRAAMHRALTRPARQRSEIRRIISSYRIPPTSYLALTCLLLSFRAAVVFAEDWPQWRGPRGDGSWNGPKLPERWPEAGLPVVWRQPVGGGYGGLAVSGGRLYVQDKQKEPAEQERVLCCDAASGELLWQHAYPVQYGKLDYGNGPRATPTIHDGRVYTLGAVGHVHCLDAGTGEVLWRHDLVQDFGAKLQEWGLAASPRDLARSGDLSSWIKAERLPRGLRSKDWPRSLAGGALTRPAMPHRSWWENATPSSLSPGRRNMSWGSIRKTAGSTRRCRTK